MILAADLNNYLHQCAPSVAVSTMRAIIQTESRGNALAIGLNHGKRLLYPAKNLQQATNWVNYLEQHNYDFDIGLGQINIRNVHKYGYLASEMLDPCKNLIVASMILRQNYSLAKSKSLTQQEALYKAISAYNTGNYRSGFRNGYVQKVVNNAFQLSQYAKN